MNISVVIPVYNSEFSLRELALRLKQVLDSQAGHYELILVNDDSRDRSWDVIFHLAREYPWIRGINLMRHYGQHNCLLCGIREARNEVIITMDDDLQHPPEEIPKLLDRLSQGYDVVYGEPMAGQNGLWRNIASQVTRLALKSVMGAKTARRASAFRAFRTHLRGAFASYQSPFVSIDVLLSWGTTRFSAIYVRHDPRRAGASNYTFGKLVSHALNMMTGFSIWPLRLASMVGFGVTLFGIGVFMYVFCRYLIEGGSVPGFPFLASIIAIFSGAQLFALGIIGEYLARMHFSSMGRPNSFIRNTTDFIPAGIINEPGSDTDIPVSHR
ncbi:MAG: glycosyltransferase family 2 protein [Deltaproteobacteria bacterium]|nr:glycosyltransferase family 2 protein [Deltaproteobacteria bacterium]